MKSCFLRADKPSLTEALAQTLAKMSMDLVDIVVSYVDIEHDYYLATIG